MNIEKMKKGLCSLKLEKMSKVYNKAGVVDPTMVRSTFSILDFSASGNKQIISKQVGIDCMDTLKFKPLVCDYIETTNYETPNDDFVEHDEKIITLRNGEEYVGSGTTPIGVCENVYMGISKNEQGEDIDVIMGDFLLWLYRYPNEISLIDDFYNSGETLYTSCEHYYVSSSKDSDGNEIIDSFIFDGHTVLGRGIEPAYTSSKLISFNENWTKAINKKRNKSINKKESGEMEKNNVLFNHLKSVNAISASDFRWKIYTELEKVMTALEYNSLYLSNYDIYPTEGYFVYDTWSEVDGYKLYKMNFTVNEDDTVTVDFESKVQSEYKCEVVPVSTELQASLNTKNTKITELESEVETVKISLNTKATEIETISNEKSGVVEKLDSANEMVISLNNKVQDLESSIEVMKPIVEAHEEALFEKSLNAIKDTYKEKFEKVGAIDIFEDDSTQELIKKSVNCKTGEFKSQLNQLIVDNVKTTIKVEDETTPSAKSINSIVKAKENKDLVKNCTDIYEDMSGIKFN